jgi:threonine/homoserine/homoserine lactone efflux protein
MPFETLLAVAGVTLFVIGTPGPANIALSAMGTAYGLRSFGFALAVPAGFLFNCLFAGFAFWSAGSLATDPLTVWVLRVGGCVYLAWLSWKIWNARVVANGDVGAPNAALGLIVHPLNPKAYLFLITVFGQFVLPAASAGTAYWTAAGSILLLLFAMGFVLNISWWLVGCLLGSALKDERQHRLVNRFMATALALVTVHLFVGGLSG